MKSKIIGALLLLLLSITITACSNSSDSKIESSKTQALSENNMNLAVEAYKTVLQNKAEFHSTDNKKKVYLNDFLTNEELYGTQFKVTRFTVLDMDGDKIPEVVLELKKDDFYEVLHYMNNEVYGYIRSYRQLENIKFDGTFGWSNSAFNDGIGKLKFKPEGCEIDNLGYCDADKYFIEDKPVTEETYDSFFKEEDRKTDAVWYEFTQNNIETELSASSTQNKSMTQTTIPIASVNETIEENSNVGDNIDSSKSQFEKGYYDYKGTINNNLYIQMSIYPLGQEIVGSYIYEKEKKEINLKGKAGENAIVLYEYDLQGKNTGIFRGTMNSVDNIQGTWASPDGKKTYPFALDLVSNLPGVEYGKRYGVSEGDNAAENFVMQIQSYVINNNKEALAEQIAYPISTKVDGKVTKIKTKDDFVSHYDQIINLNFKQAISDTFAKYLFANYQGIMFGNGMHNLWISEVMTTGGTSKLMITAINN
ncbi:hypothetical protein [Desulfosporosinus sp. OT]|uniref:hypothetical protein n=1 Tax=Desulfosporosinus sp. OT TaxID=913865 RepID=UPI0002239FA1|nr:hypothetical protein [Desulfosporosinus sp. OT]EGW40025.1 hypothetical protein DOT_2025 [Desulfosporosinus sp. OT]